ncbi:MAG: hypothetical protein WA774_19710, partial [Candidatus Acidiferrales bacterium]
VQTVQEGHADIDDDQIRFQSFGCMKQSSTVTGNANDIIVRREHASQCVGHDNMIVGQQKAWSIHGAPL